MLRGSGDFKSSDSQYLCFFKSHLDDLACCRNPVEFSDSLPVAESATRRIGCPP